MTISIVALYLNFDVDETYTPQFLSFRSGTTFNDLYEVKSCELTEPMGWAFVHFDDQYLRTNFLQIAVLSNCMNGRDSRIRQVKVFGPRRYVNISLLYQKLSYVCLVILQGSLMYQPLKTQQCTIL